MIHELAHDFVLQDCWCLPIKTERPFEDVLGFFLRVDPLKAGLFPRTLFKIRMALGKWVGWDEKMLPIPGTGERSVSERLKPDERVAFVFPECNSFSEFRPVYLRENEALMEISNQTIFALIHLGKTGDEVWMGIYTKSRGALSDLYMDLIKPFRHLIVYPAWFRLLKAEWKRSPAR